MTAIHLAVYNKQKRGQAKMEIKEILKHVDHTLLLQPSTWEEIKQICDDAIKYGTASVCIPPCYVKQAAEYMGRKDGSMYSYWFSKRKYDHSCKRIRDKRAIAKRCIGD